MNFLGHPDSQPYVRLYDDVAEELQAKLVHGRTHKFLTRGFLKQLIASLFKLDFDLRVNKKLTELSFFTCTATVILGVKMIQPSKHSHPGTKRLSRLQLRCLNSIRSKRSTQFDELETASTQTHPDAVALFLPALNLLFLLGLVIYRKHNDSFEYTGS